MTTLDEAVRAHQAGDLERAIALYGQVLDAEPWRASHNLGVIFSSLGRLDEAEGYLRRALEVRPDLAETRYSLAHVLLARGCYAEGWPLYEARRDLPRLLIPSGPEGLPDWRGEPLAGKRLLLLGEQGFGDQLMFARFVAPLRAQGAKVNYICRSGLNRLLPGSRPLATDLAGVGADCWTVSGSLGYRLGTTPDSVPPPVALAVETASGGGIGVVSRGRATHANDAHRSLTGPDEQRLLALGRDLSPEATGATDFLDTARIMAGLDLVIGVDTALVHLAAALGKPVWILLPALGTDWRWMRDRADSPWCPTARLYRQPAPGAWAAVLDAVEADLR